MKVPGVLDRTIRQALKSHRDKFDVKGGEYAPQGRFQKAVVSAIMNSLSKKNNKAFDEFLKRCGVKYLVDNYRYTDNRVAKVDIRNQSDAEPLVLRKGAKRQQPVHAHGNDISSAVARRVSWESCKWRISTGKLLGEATKREVEVDLEAARRTLAGEEFRVVVLDAVNSKLSEGQKVSQAITYEKFLKIYADAMESTAYRPKMPEIPSKPDDLEEAAG